MSAAENIPNGYVSIESEPCINGRSLSLMSCFHQNRVDGTLCAYHYPVDMIVPGKNNGNVLVENTEFHYSCG